MNYVGIDNGLKGGIAVLNSSGEILHKAVMPNVKMTIGRQIKNRVAVRPIFVMLKDYRPFKVAIECPTGSQSIQAATSMADSYARLESVIKLMGMNPQSVTNSWQKMFWTRPKNAGDYCTKKEALRVASELWPKECWLATERSKKAHDGIVDAVLIAEYVRRNEGGS